MEPIRIDVGVYTPLQVDLREFDFTGIQTVRLTMKNKYSVETVLQRDFLSASLHDIVITPAESLLLREDAEYDFCIITDGGQEYKNGGNGAVRLRYGCGKWHSESD